MIFTLEGSVMVGDTLVKEKTAAKLTEGDCVTLQSTGQGAQVLFISSSALKEPISWGGPIVMNTGEELRHTFEELENGTFLKKEVSYNKL